MPGIVPVTLQEITNVILKTPCETGGSIPTPSSQMGKLRPREAKSELYRLLTGDVLEVLLTKP